MKNDRRKIHFANFAALRAFILLFFLSASLILYSLETPDKFSSNEAWKDARQSELQTKIDAAVARGAKSSEITKIRETWMNENRALESGRTEALKNFIKDVYGVSDDKTVEEILDTDFEHSGTKPEQGQGRFGDIDLTPKPEAWKKISDYARKNPDKMSLEDGATTAGLPSQEITIHNPNKNYEYSVEKGPDGKVKIVEAGKGGAPVKRMGTVARRAANEESYLSYEFDKDGKIVTEGGASVGYDKDGRPVRKPGPKIANPHLNTLDNIKKIGDHLDKRGNFEYKKNQSTAKAVMRIIEGAYGSDPSKWPPEIADMHKKCHQVKNGVAVEELGMTDKNAKNRFYDQMEKVVKDSYAKTSADSARRDAELAAKRDQAYNEMLEAKKKMGDCVRKMDEAGLKKAQERMRQKKAEYEDVSSKLTEKRATEAIVERVVAESTVADPKRKGGAAVLLSKCKGKDARSVESKFGQRSIQDIETRKVMSPSEFESKLLEDSRKKLGDAMKAPSMDTDATSRKSHPPTRTGYDPTTGRKAFFNRVGTLLDILGAYQAGETTGEALDLMFDMNPTMKKGVQTVTAGASLLTLSQNARVSGIGAVAAGAPGAIKAGAEASIDELSQWYLENPNAGDPDFFERTKIGMRGAKNFARQYAKDTAYGLTVKPVVDVYQIAESGSGAFKAKLEKIETERKNRKNKEQMLATSEKKVFDPIKDKFDRMEKEASRILEDKSSSENARQKAKELLKELESGRNRLQWALDKQRDRDVSGDSGVDYNEEDENKKHVDYLKAQKEREQDQKDRQVTETLLATSLSKIEEKMNELNEAANSVRVKITVLDSETASPLDAEVSIAGAKYRRLGQNTTNGKTSFSDVPGGSYEISVRARGYESKQGTYSFNPSKKKEYSGNFKLTKLTPEDSRPVVAKLAVMVVDAETGAAIPGASIALESPDRNYSWSGSTPTGAMEFPTLASGNYYVSAGAPGYQAKSRNRIPIEPAKNSSPRCKVSLLKGQMPQKPDGELDFKKIADNTYVQTDDGAKRAGELNKGAPTQEKTPQKTSANNNDDIRKQIEALRAEGNAKLDQIRAELKKMEGKEISIGCPQCGHGGPHFWDGSGWTCKNCGATVCQPSKYPTSAGTYSKVRDEYKRRIAEIEAKLK